VSLLPAEVSAFIGAASDLPVESFAAIRKEIAEATAAGTRDAALAPKLDAADFSSLDKHVRDAFAARAADLRSAQPGSLRAAIANTTIAAQAIWKRDTLTPHEFDAYIGAFRAVGITVD
jgi:hypothetical protein